MKDINDHRRDRKAAANAMEKAAQTIAALEAVEGDPDASAIEAAQAEFDKAQASFNAEDRAVKRLEVVEQAQTTSAISETQQQRQEPAPRAVPAQPVNAQDRGAEVGIMVGALLNARGDVARASERLERDGHSGISAALSGATEGAGGVTIPRPSAQTLIDLLTPRVLVRSMGAMVHDMPAGEMRNAKALTGPTASYAGENAPIVESEPTFGKVDEKFKKLTSLVPIGNSLLRHSNMSVGRLIRDQMIRFMSLREDLAFIRGDGTGDTPKGVRNWCLPGNLQLAVANTALVVEAALRKMVSQVEDANVAMVMPGWMMRASTKNFLANLRDPDSGVKLFPSIEANGTLWGYPIGLSSQIPNNLGAGTNQTEVYFVDFAEIMIGDSMDITVATSTEAAFVNTSGETVSAFQSDLTLMRAIAEHDLAPAHDEGIAVLTGVGWSL